MIERDDAWGTCTCRSPLYEIDPRCSRHGHSPELGFEATVWPDADGYWSVDLPDRRASRRRR